MPPSGSLIGMMLVPTGLGQDVCMTFSDCLAMEAAGRRKGNLHCNNSEHHQYFDVGAIVFRLFQGLPSNHILPAIAAACAGLCSKRGTAGPSDRYRRRLPYDRPWPVSARRRLLTRCPPLPFRQRPLPDKLRWMSNRPELAESIQSSTSANDPFRSVPVFDSGHLQGHWITSSARTSSDCGIVRPSALAVFMLIDHSNLVGCSIGRSPGFAPLSILSTKLPALR